MRILFLSRIDCAAAGFFLSDAVRCYTPHETRMVRLRSTNTLDFPSDIVAPPEKTLRKLWEWAEVLHIHDFAYPQPNGLGPSAKPVVVTYHGTAYRDSHVKYDRACQSLGWTQTVSTVDLTLLNKARWMPDTRTDLSRFLDRPNKKFTVVHAPTKRPIKSTESIIKALGPLEGIRIVLIEVKPYEECLRRKAQGHVLVDQF